MTYAQILAIIDATIEDTVATIGSAANIPIITGRLRSSVKVKRNSDSSWTIYMDDGGMSAQEWNETYGWAAEDAPYGIAPYAGEVDEYNGYFQRVWLILYNKLRANLGAATQRMNYDSGNRER